jgi:hypothetical protein
VPSDGEANAVKVEATKLRRTTLTARASHIMEARGTLGVRLQHSTGVLVPNFPRRMIAFYFFSCANIAAFGGVLYETPSTKMPLLQKVVYHRSPQPSSPAVLSENQMPEGQQDSEPKALAIQTSKPSSLVRPGRSGTSPGLAQVASVLLEASRTPEIGCATRFHRCGSRPSAIME